MSFRENSPFATRLIVMENLLGDSTSEIEYDRRFSPLIVLKHKVMYCPGRISGSQSSAGDSHSVLVEAVSEIILIIFSGCLANEIILVAFFEA